MTFRYVRATGRRDGVEPGIVREFREAGFSVDIIGWPVDLLVGGFGVLHPVECKTGKAGFTPAQIEWRKTYKGERPKTIRTPAQARKWARIWTERAKVTRIEFPVVVDLSKTCDRCDHATDTACEFGFSYLGATGGCAKFDPRPGDWTEAVEAHQGRKA